MARQLTSESDLKNKDDLFLHVGPSGDCWTGSSIFAAKHLQPDYVKSVPLHPPHNDICAETLLCVLEEDSSVAQDLYDTGTLSDDLLEKVRQAMEDSEEGGI